jgi:hypothetical protein
MANLNDMTADVGVNQISYSSRRFWNNPALRPCRGVNREFERTYDDSTGVHNIAYSRQHQGIGCEKAVDVDLNYTFTDAEGNFIATPILSRDEISEIAFTGTRVGSGSFENRRGSKSVTYNQTGEWNLSGLQTAIATLSGSQSNNGTFEQTRPDSAGVEQTRTGSYDLQFNTVDVTITQVEGETSDLETQITGTIQYTMTMDRVTNGVEESKQVEGTIELEGDGRALLRFLGLRKIYRVSLSDGDVTETDGETRGDG